MLTLSLELNALDIGEIDGPVGTVEPRPGAVGIDAERLACCSVGAEEVERVEAAAAIDHSLPSPGFQTNVSLPAPRNAVSAPLPPTTVSSPVPPTRVSLLAPPMRVSLPLPPNRCAVGSACPAGGATLSSEIVSLPFPPNTSISVVLTSVGGLPNGYHSVVDENFSCQVAADRDIVVTVISSY